MMKRIFTFLFTAAMLFAAVNVFGQGTAELTGKVVSGEEALTGATVVAVNSESGQQYGAITDAEGNFKITNMKPGSYNVAISFVGYTKSTSTAALNSGSNDLGAIELAQDAVSLDDVVVVGMGVIDVAKDRETPVAVSTIKITEIQAKSGNQEFPEIMKNTPSVYIGGQAGGFGDGRINIRGFSQENNALLFNGQPVNGMEDGLVYWSNWQGLSDIASAIQIQRGLGSSKLAISSVGATINIVTKATDMVKNGRVSALFGNDNFMKYVASYSSGINEKGWGYSILLSHWQGDGYNDGTEGQGQTYFVSVGYKPSNEHSFNLSITGAPQWHNQNFTKSISSYIDNGWKYNNNWGMKNGEVFSWRKNFYHKPVINLNWDWTPTDKSSLSTVLYASTGQGGGTGPYGPSSAANIYTTDGQVDFDQIIDNNKMIAPTNGRIIGSYGDGASLRRASMNLHNWFGLVVNFNHDISENLSFNIGTDLRTYYGKHFRLVDNLLGLDGYWDNNYGADGFGELFEGGQLYTREHGSSPYFLLNHSNIHYDDKLDYYNNERISYLGVFGQLEYKSEKISAFVQGALSNQWYQRFDFHTYAYPEEQSSEGLEHFGYNIKAGANYNLNENHNIFANVGYYSRQPFFDDLYLNYSNEVNEAVGNEGVLSFELGYGYRSELIDIDLNAYSTKWSDRQIRQSVTFNEGTPQEIRGTAYYENVTEVHNGVELEFRLKPVTNLEVGGFASIGIWEYKDNIISRVYDEDRNLLGESTLFLDGIKVGDGAQTSFGLLANYKITKGLSIDADWRYYDNLYAAISPEAFTSEENEGSLKLPAYGLLDAGISYKYYLKNNNSFVFRFNVNNLLNKRYILESDTNIHPADGVEEWEGVNVNNRVYFGNGTTWNVSLAYKF